MPTEELYGNYNFVKGSPRQSGERLREAAAEFDPVRGSSRLEGVGEVTSSPLVVPEPEVLVEVLVEGSDGSPEVFDAVEVDTVVGVESFEVAVAVSGDDDGDGFFDDMMDGTQI